MKDDMYVFPEKVQEAVMRRVIFLFVVSLLTVSMLIDSSNAQMKMQDESPLSRYERMRLRSRFLHPYMQSKYYRMTEPYLHLDPTHPQLDDEYFENNELSRWFLNPDYSQLMNHKSTAGQPHYLNHPTGVREDWVHVYEPRTTPGVDVATDIAIDDENNVYVTGYTTHLPNGLDFYTIKYDASGNQVWGRYFDGEAHGDDIAYRIALDDSGNVYVGGNSMGVGSGSDIVIVKYNALGEEQRVVRFDESDAGQDEFGDMKIDHSGNVFIAGTSEGDFVTLKYNSRGIQEWAVYYDGPDHRSDSPSAIAIDDEGNVYVTGSSRNKYTSVGDTDIDFATVKYDSTGILQWVARYTSQGTHSCDIPFDMAVDDSMNVYVTGYRESDDYRYDYTTIKYNKDGQEIWKVFYDGLGNFRGNDIATALTTDANGNVYVTGQSRGNDGDTDYDIATVKYNSAGLEQWVARYGEGEESNNGANEIIVDDVGDIYIIGSERLGDGDSDCLIAKYNQDGNLMWSARYDGPSGSHDYASAFKVNRQGEVFVCGMSYGVNTNADYATVKFNAQGIVEWTARFNGTNTELGRATDVVADNEGNIYAAGISNGRIVMMKFESEGSVLWTSHYSAQDRELYGHVRLMTVDDQHIYAIGNQGDVIKYNSLGNQEWARRYQFCNSLNITLDRSGNIYTTDYDFKTRKYRSSGVQEWEAIYSADEYSYCEASCTAVDNQGNVYVFGYGVEYDGEYRLCLITIKYDPGGQQEWVRYFKGLTSIRSYRLALDGWGNVYVAGRLADNVLCVVKYSPNGQEQWSVQHHEENKHSNRIIDMKVDVYGNIHLIGKIADWNTSLWESFILKYNTNGVEQWISYFQGSFSDLTLDCDGNVYATGYCRWIGTGSDIVTIKYNVQGEEQWIFRHENPGNAWSEGHALDVDCLGNVYVASETAGNQWSLFKVIKYSQTEGDSLIAPEISGYSLMQNHPNPSNNQTLIWYELPKSSRVAFKVFSILGQEVISDELGEKAKGKHPYYVRTDDLPSGIYYYRIQAGDPSTGSGQSFVETKKMVVVH
ncbi:MAG: SBBP repeat-containing protein [bacterium]